MKLQPILLITAQKKGKGKQSDNSYPKMPRKQSDIDSCPQKCNCNQPDSDHRWLTNQNKNKIIMATFLFWCQAQDFTHT